MKKIALAGLAVLAVIAAVGGLASSSRAATTTHLNVAVAKQPVVTGFYNDKVVSYYDFGPIKLKAGNKLAPIWTVTNGPSSQHNIVDTVPGLTSYSPLWQLNRVTWKTGATPRLLRSANEVKQAEKAGDVTVRSTSIVVNCPLLGFGQKHVTGFSNGHRIHYLDLGPVKVLPGNQTAPLYAPMNGVAGQHNIALENIAIGQTKYPALWTIVAINWKAGAHKTLLTSAAQVKKAQAAGLLTVTPTSLVVNCPVVD